MAAGYTRLWADSRHSGFIEGGSGASGRLAWTRKIAADPEERVSARLVLSTGDHVLVEGVSSIHAFDGQGKALWSRPKWYGTPIGWVAPLVYYSSAERKDRMEGADLANLVRFSEFPIPGMIEDSFIVLFEPFKDGLVAQVQDGGTPDVSPMSFSVYRRRKGGLGYDWHIAFQGEESPLMPLLAPEVRRLVTATREEAIVLDTEPSSRAPSPAARFPLPLGEGTRWVSAGRDGRLHWAGAGDTGVSVRCTDPEGKELWAWSGVAGEPVAPPILGSAFVYLLTGSVLLALSEGDLVWRCEAEEAAFDHATALADGTILVAGGRWLRKVDATGRALYATELEEAIVTPPVVDAKGRVYVAGRENLHALD